MPENIAMKNSDVVIRKKIGDNTLLGLHNS